MKIEIVIDEKFTDLGVRITAPDLTPDIERIISLLRMMDMQIPVRWDDETILLDVDKEFGIAMTKKLEGDVMRMCNLSKAVYERAVDKTLVDTIKNLLESTDWDIDKCMDNMKIPKEKREAYKAAVYGGLVSA